MISFVENAYKLQICSNGKEISSCLRPEVGVRIDCRWYKRIFQGNGNARNWIVAMVVQLCI